MLEGVYIPFDAFMRVLRHIGVDMDDRGSVYREIAEYVQWRRSQPEDVGSKGMPCCTDNESDVKLINWRHEFIRVCTSVAHVWTDSAQRVLVNQPQWTQKRQTGAQPIPPAVVYCPAGERPLPLLWFDYDPWKGTFDIPAHSWPPTMDPMIQIMLICVKDAGDQTISRVLVDINRPAEALVSTALGKPALTLSVNWIDALQAGKSRYLTTPRVKVLSGLPQLEFAVLVTLSNVKHDQKHKLSSIYYCQGRIDNNDLHGLPRTGAREVQTSKAHQCVYSQWCYDNGAT
jgi:hypothetical protein